MVGKSLDTGSLARKDVLGRIPQDKLLANELLSSLREISFSEQEFSAGKPISDYKYHHLGFQNNHSFYPFND